MALSNSGESHCPICQNVFALQSNGEKAAGHRCSFCQSLVGLPGSNDALDNITGYKILRVADVDAPAKVYVAEREDEKFLITLLEEGSSLYSALYSFGKRGDTDPYGAAQLPQ